jgi:hypothetical protein
MKEHLAVPIAILVCVGVALPAAGQQQIIRPPRGGGPNYAPVAPASWYFCGNGRKVSTSDGCKSAAVYPNDDALERVEVRGWIVASGDPRADGSVDNGPDEEFELNLLVDVGWTPSEPGASAALNSAKMLGDWLTPFNIVSFGVPYPAYNPPLGNDPARAIPQGVGFPDMPAQYLTELNHDKTTWGSGSAAVLHIEVDGWGPERGCHPGGLANYLGPPEKGCAPPYAVPPPPWPMSDWPPDQRAALIKLYCDSPNSACYDYRAEAPSGWAQFATPSSRNSAQPIYWPFALTSKDSNGNTIGVFRNGMYVQLVGTLWRDGYHGPKTTFYPPRGYGDLGDAQSCWQGADDYTDNGGHLEVHPVDSMVVMPDGPTQSVLHTVGAYQICGKNGNLSTIVDVFRPGGRPAYLNAQSHVDEYVRGDFTNWRSLRPSADAPRYSVGPLGDVTVRVSAEDNPIPAKFMALYDAYWTCSPSCSGRCGGDDGCGGVCPPQPCSNGRACISGLCQCPSGTAECPVQGNACVTPDACCPSGQKLCECSVCAADCETACAPPAAPPEPACPPGRVMCDCTDNGACLPPATCRRLCWLLQQ